MMKVSNMKSKDRPKVDRRVRESRNSTQMRKSHFSSAHKNLMKKSMQKGAYSYAQGHMNSHDHPYILKPSSDNIFIDKYGGSSPKKNMTKKSSCSGRKTLLSRKMSNSRSNYRTRNSTQVSYCISHT